MKATNLIHNHLLVYSFLDFNFNNKQRYVSFFVWKHFIVWINSKQKFSKFFTIFATLHRLPKNSKTKDQRTRACWNINVYKHLQIRASKSDEKTVVSFVQNDHEICKADLGKLIFAEPLSWTRNTFDSCKNEYLNSIPDPRCPSTCTRILFS